MDMAELDSLRIVLDPIGQIGVSVALMLVMFSVALGLRVDDFRFLFERPLLFFGGLVSQVLLLPLVTYILILIMQPAPSIALGMIVVACCPGGAVSNLLTYLSRGSLAVSVALTASSSMLAVARANLDRAGIGNVQVRLGDIYNLPLPRDSFNLVVVHQVLHFLDDPERALAEAARVLRPGGRLLIVDFAPHDLEFLREEHAHRRLGFGRDQVAQWVQAPGLKLDQVVELPSGDDDKLKVILWLARDQRIAVAGDADREVA